MSSSSYYTINGTWTTGTIIAVVVGSIAGLATLIGTIIAIVCIFKCLNRSRDPTPRRMVLQPTQTYPYPYPQPWANQYPSNTNGVANYPPMYQTVAAPYTVPTPNYVKPTDA